MKILIVSDSHGCVDPIRWAIALERPDYLIHLGDHSRDADKIIQEYSKLPVVSVRGNCDYADFITQEQANLILDGIKIFAVHGHTYHVKNSLLRLYMAAKEKNVHVALFGHTHIPFCELKEGLWLLNPGSCGRNSRQTYGIIEISRGEVGCKIKTLEEGTVTDDTCD